MLCAGYEWDFEKFFVNFGSLGGLVSCSLRPSATEVIEMKLEDLYFKLKQI